jgi:hypothetical protein
MATTTTNFGWDIPQSTDLVKDGATAIAALGQDIDTALVDLKGGTTGQVLAKASGTDLDYSWVTTDDANAIQNAIVDAKGDLIAASAADTPARLAVGTNGQVLTADSTASTGLAWATPVSASINLLLNSNFALNQRAYVSGDNLTSGSYGFDRWKANFTNTALTFTASTQGQSLTITTSGGLQQVIEQGLVPSGTYTLSWTGTATARVYNSGATPPSYAASPVTFTADGLANVVVEFTASGSTKTLSKVQFSAGTGTTWSLATPTLETELAACQRYYWRLKKDSGIIGHMFKYLTTDGMGFIELPVLMRVTPTSMDILNVQFQQTNLTNNAIVGPTLNSGYSTNKIAAFTYGQTGLPNAEQGYAALTTSGFIGFSAEL